MKQAKKIASKKAFNKNVVDININSLAMFELVKDFLFIKGIGTKEEIDTYLGLERFEAKINELSQRVNITYFG